MLRIRVALLAGLALLALPAAARAAVAPGVVSFDLGGAVPQPGAEPSGAVATALRPDGGLLAAGPLGTARVVVLAFARDGRPDPAFGQGGRVSVPVPSPRLASVDELVRRPDGSLVVLVPVPGATVESPQRVALVGLTAAGAVDPGFHGGQPVETDLGVGAAAVSAPDGGLVLSGTGVEAGATAWRVERLRPDGSPDPTFGAQGAVALAGAGARGGELVLGADGRLTALGFAGEHAELRRLRPDGTADPSWAGGDALGLGRAAYGLRVRADGTADLATGGFDTQSVIRVRADGTQDPAVAPVPLTPGPRGTTLLPAPDGGLVAVRSLTQDPASGRAQVRLQRLDASDALVDDRLVTLPLAGGRAAPNHGTTLDQTGALLAGAGVRADGTLLLAGEVGLVQYTGEGEGVHADVGALASLLPDGAPDPAFGGPATPAQLELRVLRQRVSTAVADRVLRVGVRTSGPGLVDLHVRGLGRELAHATLPAYRGGGQTLKVLLLNTARSRLRGHHRVTLTLSATLRDVVGQDATATASNRLP